jgi:hypothetical protein
MLKDIDTLSADEQHVLLQTLVEVPPITSKLDAELCLPQLFRVLRKELPASIEDPTTGLLSFPDYNLNTLEPLLIFFHHVIAHNPGNLTSVTGLSLDLEFLSRTGTGVKKSESGVSSDPSDAGLLEPELNGEQVQAIKHDFLARLYFLQNFSKIFTARLRDKYYSDSHGAGSSNFVINATNSIQNIYHLCKVCLARIRRRKGSRGRRDGEAREKGGRREGEGTEKGEGRGEE